MRHLLLNWLYEDVIETEYEPTEFGTRFKEITSIVGLDGIDLSKRVGVDIMVIDPFWSGKKIPPKRSVLFNKMCGEIVACAAENGTLGSVAELLGYKGELAPDVAVPLVWNWIMGTTASSDNMLAAQIIKQIVSPEPLPKLPDPYSVATDEVVNEEQDFYVGVSGLQRAVIRFLGTAVRTPGTEMLLYSDQNMDWMQASFTPKWLALMLECLNKGVKIKIVHNVDRDPSEMLFAVRSWLPLYMAGHIESTYRIDNSGDRFCHTAFISNNASIDGFCLTGGEHECVYHYSTDEDHIGKLRRSFVRFDVKSKTLVSFENGTFEPKKIYTIYEFEQVLLYVSQNEVIICKTGEQSFWFKFRHPYLIRMFTNYARDHGNRIGESR